MLTCQLQLFNHVFNHVFLLNCPQMIIAIVFFFACDGQCTVAAWGPIERGVAPPTIFIHCHGPPVFSSFVFFVFLSCSVTDGQPHKSDLHRWCNAIAIGVSLCEKHPPKRVILTSFFCNNQLIKRASASRILSMRKFVPWSRIKYN